MRLEKRVAHDGACSRRQARSLIRRGRVAVDGAVVRDPSLAVDDGTTVAIDGDELRRPPDVVVFHKPAGVQCTIGDPMGRTSLQEVAADILALGLHPVGRLDADSEGLLLFCRDGALTQRLLHPKHGVRKVYVADVCGAIPADLGERLAAGVETALGTFEGALREVSGQRVTLSVTEGKHRMVRRMLANLGMPVERLVRVQMGAVELGELPAGAWRVVTRDVLG